MKLSLWYPIKPPQQNQGFGSNPDYYARFLDAFGKPEKGHMGIDFAASHGQGVYAAHDGLASFKRDSHGGEGIYLRTPTPYEYNGSEAYFESIYWHLVGDSDASYTSPVPLDGIEYPVKAGDLIGYADNTGAPFESTGTHLHFGLVPLDHNMTQLEPANGFGGCIDPAPFFNGYIAQDKQTVLGLYQALVLSLKALVGALSAKK